MVIKLGNKMQCGSIQISGERISTKDAKEFCEALDANKVKILALRECGISKKNFMRLMISVGYCQSLVHVNLNHCGITCVERVDMLAAALSINKSISALLLHGNHFSTEGVIKIVKSVILHPYLTCLDVGDCDLGDKGLKYVCELLPANITRPGLQELVLSGNPRINPRAWEKFSVALSACSTLRALYIDFNNIGDVAGKMLVVSAAGHPTLSILDMEACELSDEVGRLLLHLLQKYPTTLTHILLEDNRVCCDTVMNIRIALGESDSECSSDNMDCCPAKKSPADCKNEPIKSINCTPCGDPCNKNLSEKCDRLSGGAVCERSSPCERVKRQKRDDSCDKKTKIEAVTDDDCSNYDDLSLEISISNRKPNQCTSCKSKQPRPIKVERKISEASTTDDGSTLELSVGRKSRRRSSSASEDDDPIPVVQFQGRKNRSPTSLPRSEVRPRLPSIPEQKSETGTVHTQTTNRRTRRNPPIKPDPLPILTRRETICAETQTNTRKAAADDIEVCVRHKTRNSACGCPCERSNKSSVDRKAAADDIERCVRQKTRNSDCGCPCERSNKSSVDKKAAADDIERCVRQKTRNSDCGCPCERSNKSSVDRKAAADDIKRCVRQKTRNSDCGCPCERSNKSSVDRKTVPEEIEVCVRHKTKVSDCGCPCEKSKRLSVDRPTAAEHIERCVRQKTRNSSDCGCLYERSKKSSVSSERSSTRKSSISASCQTNCQPLPPFGARPEMRARKRKYRTLGSLGSSVAGRHRISQLVEVDNACQRAPGPGTEKIDACTRVCYVKGKRSTSRGSDQRSSSCERKRRKSSSRSPWCGGGSDCSKKRKMSESPEYIELQKLRKHILKEKMELNSRKNAEVMVLSTRGSSLKLKQTNDPTHGTNSRRQTIFIDLPSKTTSNSRSDSDLTKKLKGKHLSNAWTSEVS